jgi:GNAT superfamily N-acetyltransferase
MPIRVREKEDVPRCVAVLRQVHQVSGYPSGWPEDPGGWLTPVGLMAAWVAEHDGLIAGHVALVRGARAPCLLRATGRDPDQLGGVARLFVGPAARRQGTARALLETATADAWARGLQPVLDVVDDSRPAIALYERSGWRLVGTQTATWTTPAGVSPMLRYYVGSFAGDDRPLPQAGQPGLDLCGVGMIEVVEDGQSLPPGVMRRLAVA